MNQVSPQFFDMDYSGERRNIVTVGRLNEQKNQELLIRAYSQLSDETEDELLIYGVGPLRRHLEELIGELGLENRIHLMGLSKNVPKDIKSAKTFVLPSDYEGMPNALMEAMALRLPCIATACPCGGAEMLIENGVNGLLIPVGDEGELTQKLRLLLGDEQLRAEMGRKAGIRAESFRPARIFEDWKRYVETVIGAAPNETDGKNE